jgi:uncharacterized protein DUF2334
VSNAVTTQAESWLPDGKQAAICFTIDDVHPGRSTDAYEAGGDLRQGGLGRVEWLLERHPHLAVTLFVTADWRELSPFPTRRILAAIPFLRDRMFLARTLPAGTMRLDRHPAFTRYLRRLPRTEIGLHGLHHVHRGRRIPVEFQDQNAEKCRRMISEAVAVFRAAGLEAPRGMTPPGWDVPTGLATAMRQIGLAYVASARDIVTPVSADARTNMSGLRGLSLIHPERIEGGSLVHIPTNFQATSPLDRAVEIVAQRGLVSVKAHIVKTAYGYVASDGLDLLYRNYLDLLFTELHRRYGDSLWWATMSEVAARVATAADVSTG